MITLNRSTPPGSRPSPPSTTRCCATCGSRSRTPTSAPACSTRVGGRRPDVVRVRGVGLRHGRAVDPRRGAPAASSPTSWRPATGHQADIDAANRRLRPLRGRARRPAARRTTTCCARRATTPSPTSASTSPTATRSSTASWPRCFVAFLERCEAGDPATITDDERRRRCWRPPAAGPSTADVLAGVRVVAPGGRRDRRAGRGRSPCSPPTCSPSPTSSSACRPTSSRRWTPGWSRPARIIDQVMPHWTPEPVDRRGRQGSPASRCSASCDARVGQHDDRAADDVAGARRRAAPARRRPAAARRPAVPGRPRRARSTTRRSSPRPSRVYRAWDRTGGTGRHDGAARLGRAATSA